jgi:predicted GNAT family acetyltransferase
MQIELDEIIVKNNSAESRFEVRVDEHLAVIDYYREGNEIVFTHTGVPDALGGQGLAGKMAKTALEHAKSNGLDVVPNCPFVRAYIRRHSEYLELVSDSFGEL